MDKRLANKQKGPETRIKIIQRMAKATRDNPPIQDELSLFWSEMDYWESLDGRVAAALVQVWNDASRILNESRGEAFLRKLLQFDNMASGVRNCTAHFMGSMMREAIGRSNEQRDDLICIHNIIVESLNRIINDLQSLSYKDYNDLLKRCNCNRCIAAIEFDTR